MQSKYSEYRSIYNKTLDLADFIFKMSCHAPLDFVQDSCYISRYVSGSPFMFFLHLCSLIGAGSPPVCQNSDPSTWCSFSGSGQSCEGARLDEWARSLGKIVFVQPKMLNVL